MIKTTAIRYKQSYFCVSLCHYGDITRPYIDTKAIYCCVVSPFVGYLLFYIYSSSIHHEW